MMGRLSWPQEWSPAPECAVLMFISQRFDGCHGVEHLGPGIGSETALRGCEPLSCGVFSAQPGLFLYSVGCLGEAGARASQTAIREEPVEETGAPGSKFLLNGVRLSRRRHTTTGLQGGPLTKGKQMSEVEDTPRTYSGALLAAIAVALLLGVGALIWSYTLSSRLNGQEAALADAKQQNVKLAAELRETNARLKVATEELGNSLGLTQKQMDARAQADHAARAGRQQASGERPEADRAASDRRLQRCVEREDRCGRREDRPGQDADRPGHHHQPVAVDEGRSERPQQPDRAQSR